jgi:protein phosphatase 1 regulatory subunit 10
LDVETDECRVEKCRVERFSSRAFFFLFRDDAPRFPSLTFRSFPLLSCPPRRSLEGNAALSEAKTYALAEEFHISPREVLAVVEHFKMKAEAASSPAKRAAAVVDDDDDEGPTFTITSGISDEVRAQVCCGDLHATLVLPKGYSKQQEYVIYADGRKATPAQMEHAAGKGASKNWKFTVRMVEPDGSAGCVFKKWMDQTGYYPKGHDPAAPPAKRDNATKKARAKAAQKEKQEKKASKAKQAEAPAKPAVPAARERSLFEKNLDTLLDDDGGVKLKENIRKLVWMMKNAENNSQRSVVVSVIFRTRSGFLGEFISQKGLEILKTWLELAKTDNKSSLILKILLTLKNMPMSVAALKETGWGKTVSKLQKYAPAKEPDAKKSAKENEEAAKKAADLAERVRDQAGVVKSIWESLVLKESQEAAAKEAAAEKEKALKAEREKMAGAKRDASAILASAAKRTKIDAGKNPVAATKIGGAAVARPTTTTTIVRQAASSSKSSGLSFGGINIRGAGFAPERPAGLVKAATKAKAPSPPPAPMLYKKKPSKKAAKGIKGITWPDSHDSLEMAKFFYKADPPVACNPDPDVVEKLYDLGAKHPVREDVREEPEEEEADEEEDEEDETAVAAARERQERELAAEARAAQLTRQRRLNEMRAMTKWRKPRRVPYAEDVEIAKGEESVEAARLRDLARSTREVTFKTLNAVPDSPAEAPPADAGGAASATTMEIPLLTKITPEQQRQQEQQQRLLQQQQDQQRQRQMMHAHMPPGPPPGPPGPPPPGQPTRLGVNPGGVDAASLQALLNSVQSNPALMANLGAARSTGGAPGASAMYGICAFFNTPQGCHRGNACKFKHVRDAPAGPQAFPFIKRQG